MMLPQFPGPLQATVTCAVLVLYVLGAVPVPIHPSNMKKGLDHILKVEMLKTKIRNGLNMTVEPTSPSSTQSSRSQTISRSPLYNQHSQPPPGAIPNAIVWAEPDDANEKGSTNHLLFRVSQSITTPNQETGGINRACLVLRLRFKDNNSNNNQRKRRSRPKAPQHDVHTADQSNVLNDQNVETEKQPTKSDQRYKTREGHNKTNDAQDKSRSRWVKADGSRDKTDSGQYKVGGGKNLRRVKSLEQGQDSSSKADAVTQRQKNKLRRVSLLVQALNDQSGKFKRVAEQYVTVNSKVQWINMPIPASLVMHAAQSPNHTLVLKVRCKRCRKSSVSMDSVFPPNKVKHTQEKTSKTSSELKLNPNRPYLVILNKETPAELSQPLERSVRDVGSDQCHHANTTTAESSSCCAEHVYLSFQDFGWDHWIVYPSGFTTAVCNGQCRNRKSDGPGDDDKRWSCEAKKRSSLTLLYHRDPNTVVRATIPDLITNSCGCLAT